MQLIVAVDWKAMRQSCFYVLNLINMASLQLDFFYPFHHKRHQHITAMDPKPCEESLRKAKLYLDKVPEDLLADTSLYKAFYNYILLQNTTAIQGVQMMLYIT